MIISLRDYRQGLCHRHSPLHDTNAVLEHGSRVVVVHHVGFVNQH